MYYCCWIPGNAHCTFLTFMLLCEAPLSPQHRSQESSLVRNFQRQEKFAIKSEKRPRMLNYGNAGEILFATITVQAASMEQRLPNFFAGSFGDEWNNHQNNQQFQWWCLCVQLWRTQRPRNCCQDPKTSGGCFVFDESVTLRFQNQTRKQAETSETQKTPSNNFSCIKHFSFAVTKRIQ